METHERTLVFGADSACLAGHFPGNPVVPAAAILAELVEWAERVAGRPVTGVASARFRRPLPPDVCWRLTLECRPADVATVTGRDAERVVLNARLTLGQG